MFAWIHRCLYPYSVCVFHICRPYTDTTYYALQDFFDTKNIHFYEKFSFQSIYWCRSWVCPSVCEFPQRIRKGNLIVYSVHQKWNWNANKINYIWTLRVLSLTFRTLSFSKWMSGWWSTEWCRRRWWQMENAAVKVK